MLITTQKLQKLQIACSHYIQSGIDINKYFKTPIFTDNVIFYKNLLDKKIEIDYTYDELKLLEKCKADIEFYANQTFTLLKTEKDMLDSYLENDITINFCARSVGESFISNTIITHQMLFNDSKCLYMLNTEYNHKTPMRDILRYLGNNSMFLQVPLKISKAKISLYRKNNPYSGSVVFSYDIPLSERYDFIYMNSLNLKDLQLFLASQPNAKIMITIESSLDNISLDDVVLETLNQIALDKNKKISIQTYDSENISKNDKVFGNLYSNPLYLKNKIGSGILYGNGKTI